MVKDNRTKAFTLVELMVVMGIILILAAIVFPVMSSVRRTAMSNKAHSDIRMLHTAINAFRSEYHRFPLVRQASQMQSDLRYDNAELMASLLANDRDDNPRGIAFLRISEASLNERGEFCDPWRIDGTRHGTPYEAEVDANYSGYINFSNPIERGNLSINTVTNVPVAVWTLGDLDDPRSGVITSWGGEFTEN